MSRYYKIVLETRQATVKEVLQVMEEELNWIKTDCYVTSNDLVSFEGEGNLCGGQSEHEAYEEIKQKFKDTLNRDIKFLVRMMYLEEVPCNTYGDLE